MTNMRCVWQSILDQQLVILAETTRLLKRLGAMPMNFKQYRVDGLLLQGPKALREKVLGLAGLTWGELSQQAPLFPKHLWPRSTSQAPVFGKCAAIPPASPTVINLSLIHI